MTVHSEVSIDLAFLGWDTPALPYAATELVRRYGSADTGELDMGHVVVVVPGERAGRRLREHLVDLAAADGLRLTPPDVVTESGLPERL